MVHWRRGISVESRPLARRSNLLEAFKSVGMQALVPEGIDRKKALLMMRPNPGNENSTSHVRIAVCISQLTTGVRTCSTSWF